MVWGVFEACRSLEARGEIETLVDRLDPFRCSFQAILGAILINWESKALWHRILATLVYRRQIRWPARESHALVPLSLSLAARGWLENSKKISKNPTKLCSRCWCKKFWSWFFLGLDFCTKQPHFAWNHSIRISSVIFSWNSQHVMIYGRERFEKIAKEIFIWIFIEEKYRKLRKMDFWCSFN